MSVKGTVLEKILDKKMDEVARLKQETDIHTLRLQAEATAPARDFTASLRQAPHTAVIAEIKKASPSAGTLKSDVRIDHWAGEYQKGGAAALSVLTDGPFFGGHLDDLKQARQAVGLPILRKDFIIDPLQVYQARAAGADAILLIVAALDRSLLHDLYQQALALGLTALVEVHQEEEIDAALALNPPLLGINNRDLTTLEVSLETCLKLRPRVTNGALVVAESGIKGPQDVARLRSHGLNAFLVGTLLMQAPDPRAMLDALCRAGD